MSKYIATFYSHFGALTYYQALKSQGISAKLMPVPRKVSSSCGTCVSYEHSLAIDQNDCDLDSVFMEDNNVLVCILKK